MKALGKQKAVVIASPPKFVGVIRRPVKSLPSRSRRSNLATDDPTSEEETTDLNEKILDPQAMDVDKQPLEDDIPDVTQKPKVTNIGSAHQTDEDKDEDEDEDDNGDKAKDAPQNDDGQVRASRPDETETGDNKMQEIADNLPPVSPGQASAHPVDDLALADMDLDDPNRPGTPSFSGNVIQFTSREH